MNITEILKIAQLVQSSSKALEAVNSAPKDGTKTTEFWLTSAMSLFSILSPSIPAPYNILVPAVLTGIYTLSRAAVKLAHGLGKAQNIPDLPDLPVGTPVSSGVDSNSLAAPAITPIPGTTGS